MTNDQISKIISLSAQGITTREIGAITGLHHTSVVKSRQRPEIAARIEQEAAELINRGLTSARKTLTRLAARGCSPKDQDNPAVLKLALDASKSIVSAAGLSGQAPSTIINNMLQINQAPDQTQELSDLASFLTSRMATIDVQANDIQSNTGSENTIDAEDATEEVIEVGNKYPVKIEMDKKYPDGEVNQMGVKVCSIQTHTSPAPLNDHDDRASGGQSGNLSESEVEGDADD